ncbi:sentrin-specific protease 6-like [Phlebotomus argentipes]|uniref:sentrin-specific protease 6-like n=1 Tax=Phlebotomus argentipes TaxID=94469 RepID=UPI002892E7C5|nr:sentrin-specific protease 6-like [Phlebotomus argentipes]
MTDKIVDLTVNDGASCSRRSVHQILIYPEGQGGISINTEDYKTLAAKEFVNDVIIDFFLNYLRLTILSEEQREKTHFFSSFFYERLSAVPSRDQRQAEKNLKMTVTQKRHNRVKRWTKNVNLFEKDFVVIPINKRNHWFLAIICFPGLDGPRTYSEGVPMRRLDRHQPIKQPCILIFDSMFEHAENHVVATLRDYLTCEYQAKVFPMANPSSHVFNERNMPSHSVKLPQQENCFDCGLFLLQYAQEFFCDPIRDFRLPIRQLENWFWPVLPTRKREEIAKLLIQLIKESHPERLDLLPHIPFPTCDGRVINEGEL